MKQMNKTMLRTMTFSLMLLLMLGVFAQTISASDSESNASDEDELTAEEEAHVARIRANAGTSTASKEREVYVAMTPDKAIAEPGEKVEYAVYIKDLHEPRVCEGETVCAQVMDQYTYDLEVETNQEFEVELSQTDIELIAGQETKVILTVSSDKKGANIFAVNVIGEDSKARVKGLHLINSNGEIAPTSEKALFVGDGFLVNGGETKGSLIKLSILDEEGVLKGKAVVGNLNFRVDGTVDGEKINLEFSKPEGNEVLFYFSGTLQKFESFLLLKGNVNSNYDEIESGSLTAFGRRQYEIRPVVFENQEQKSEKTRLKEVISLEKKEKVSEEGLESDEIYIKTLRVRKERILGLIPNPWGKKVLDVEVVKDDKVLKQKLREREEKIIEGYRIRAENLEDEENIELQIEKA